MREDWIEVELGEVFFTTSGGTPSRRNKSYYEGHIPWVKSGELDKGVINKTEENISEEAVKKSSAKIFPKGTLLIALYGATIGKLAFLGVNATTNQAICGIYKNVNISHNFLFYYLFFRKPKLISKGSGGAQPNISQTILKKLRFPIIPLPIQRAIVSKIETLFSDLDNGIANLKKAQEQLKIYRQAVLKKAFEGELTKEWREKRITNYELGITNEKLPTAEELLEQIKEERQNHYNKQIEDWKKAVKEWEKNGKEGKKPTKPKKWKEIIPLTNEELKYLFTLQTGISWRKIGETCTVKGGKRLPKGQEFSKEKTPYKYIMAGNLKNGTVINKVNYINKVTYETLYHYRVNKDDAYITIVGACIGDAGVIPEAQHLSILTENAAKIICTSSLSSKYLSFWLNSLVAQIRIKQSIFSMTLGKLALSRIEEIEFPLCSLPEQNQIVQEIESRLSVTDNLEFVIRNSLLKAKALRQSILKKAFEGKLLSKTEIEACKKEKNYEPASVLLEKIKAEKLEKEQEAKNTKKIKRK